MRTLVHVVKDIFDYRGRAGWIQGGTRGGKDQQEPTLVTLLVVPRNLRSACVTRDVWLARVGSGRCKVASAVRAPSDLLAPAVVLPGFVGRNHW